MSTGSQVVQEAAPEPPRRRRRLLAVVLALVVVAALAATAVVALSHRSKPTACRGPACSGTHSGTPAPSASGGATSSPSAPAPAPGALKPALKGLLDRDGMPPVSYLGTAVQGWVVQASWAQLQPTQNGPIAPDNPIDQALAEVRRLNAAHPNLHLGLKLRVYAGPEAPDWAKSLGGPPVSIVNPQGGQAGSGATVGRFWTEEFGRAYADLQVKLAAKYDSAPELRETVISRCTLVYAESFVRLRGSRASIDNLLAAGFSTAADRTCLQESVQAHLVWRHTRSDLQFLPYQDIEQRGPRGGDEAFTEEMMRYCRSTLGPRCVLANNSLRYPPNYAPLNAAFKALGGPITYQTAAPSRVGDLMQAIAYGIAQGAGSIELPATYKQIPPSTFTAENAQLLRSAS